MLDIFNTYEVVEKPAPQPTLRGFCMKQIGYSVNSVTN